MGPLFGHATRPNNAVTSVKPIAPIVYSMCWTNIQPSGGHVGLPVRFNFGNLVQTKAPPGPAGTAAPQPFDCVTQPRFIYILVRLEPWTLNQHQLQP